MNESVEISGKLVRLRRTTESDLNGLSLSDQPRRFGGGGEATISTRSSVMIWPTMRSTGTQSRIAMAASWVSSVRYLFDVRGRHRLIIDPAADNEPAIACYSRLGFRLVGV